MWGGSNKGLEVALDEGVAVLFIYGTVPDGFEFISGVKGDGGAVDVAPAHTLGSGEPYSGQKVSIGEPGPKCLKDGLGIGIGAGAARERGILATIDADQDMTEALGGVDGLHQKVQQNVRVSGQRQRGLDRRSLG